jgi:hypothetical protein
MVARFIQVLLWPGAFDITGVHRRSSHGQRAVDGGRHAEPAQFRTQQLREPGAARTAVGIPTVEVDVGGGGEPHGNKAHDHHSGSRVAGSKGGCRRVGRAKDEVATTVESKRLSSLARSVVGISGPPLAAVFGGAADRATERDVVRLGYATTGPSVLHRSGEQWFVLLRARPGTERRGEGDGAQRLRRAGFTSQYTYSMQFGPLA